MKIKFGVETLTYSTIDELPNGWSVQDYKNLLEEMDVDGISELSAEESREMCLMSLTDNEPENAAKIVLKYVFKDRLSSGQIDNISNEMLDEKMWEEYPDLSCHENFFNATSILYEAFNGSFPHAKAVSFQVKITTKQEENFEVFDSNAECPLVRLLVQGMPETTLIHRLFDDKLESGPFEETADIIWQLQKTRENSALTFDVISSLYWFHDIESVDTFEGELILEE